MIKEEGMVTKKYLAKQLLAQKIEIFEEVRAEIHNTIDGTAKNMKAYYRLESKRHMGILLESFRDEIKAYADGMKAHSEKLENHETRLDKAGF